jgi:hypothetical protein
MEDRRWGVEATEPASQGLSHGGAAGPKWEPNHSIKQIKSSMEDVCSVTLLNGWKATNAWLENHDQLTHRVINVTSHDAGNIMQVISHNPFSRTANHRTTMSSVPVLSRLR